MKNTITAALLAALFTAPALISVAHAAPSVDPGIKHTPPRRNSQMPLTRVTPAPWVESMPGAKKPARSRSKVRVLPPTSKAPQKKAPQTKQVK